jgi:cell division protease FtsH
LNEAAILTARRDKRAIGMDELVESIERVMAGPARKGQVLSDEERRVTAYHEAGHAVVFEMLEHSAPVRRISIVSRGSFLGYVMPLPDEERRLKSQAEYEDELAGALGGRVAEELIFEEITTGATADLKQVTRDVKDMVTRFGMSEEIGPMQLVQGETNPFLGMDLGERRSYSEDVARVIDREMRRIVETAYVRAKDVLTTHQDKLHLLAETLQEKEVLERNEFLKLMELA